MSWAEVKHALNGTLGTSDFKSLDKIIDNGITEIKTPGAVSIVKSVQRGTTSSTTVSISTVNPQKCVVILDNEVLAGNVGGSRSHTTDGSYVKSLTANKLSITKNLYWGVQSDSDHQFTGTVSWQVIEFY